MPKAQAGPLDLVGAHLIADRLNQGTDVSGLSMNKGYLHKIPITDCYSASQGYSS
jgi:hypothetical protein